MHPLGAFYKRTLFTDCSALFAELFALFYKMRLTHPLSKRGHMIFLNKTEFLLKYSQEFAKNESALTKERVN